MVARLDIFHCNLYVYIMDLKVILFNVGVDMKCSHLLQLLPIISHMRCGGGLYTYTGIDVHQELYPFKFLCMQVNLAQAVVYMARAPKSIEVCKAYSQAKASVKGHKGPLPSVPLHLRNAPTRLMKDLGYSKGYKYNPDYREPVDQQYMPEGLEGMNFFTD